MKITIDCNLNITEDDCLKLVISLLENRKPENGSFNYGLESHGVLDFPKLGFPVHVVQTNDRKTDKSPINIKIEKHAPLI